MTPDSPGTQQGSGLSLLVEWANGQDHWIRKLVQDVIETLQRLSDERINALYQVLLREKDLGEGELVDIPLLTAAGALASSGQSIRLVAVRHIENVNALAPNQEIEFHPQLTICFGENASGKTGYVRILKRAAGVRTADPILPNIHSVVTAATPRAQIKFTAGDDEHTIEWRGEQGLDPLTRIDVFDARAAVVHLADDLSYSYTPADLSLFPLVTDGIERVQEKLRRAEQESRPSTNPFLGQFQPESSLYTQIAGLGASADLMQLEQLANVSEGEETSLPRLRENVWALRSGLLQQQIRKIEQERRALEATHRITETIAGFDRDAYVRAYSTLRTTQAEHERATSAALSGESVPDVLGDTWKQFVESAEAYIGEIGLDLYPQEGDLCVYCRQPLGGAAVALLQKYRDYCNDALRRAVDEARGSLQRLSAPVRELTVEETASAVEALLQALEDPSSPPPVLVTARDCVAYARLLNQALASEQECPQLPEVLRNASATLDATREASEKILGDLRRQGVERDRALAEEEQRLRELETRLTLRSLLPQIRDFVEAAHWADRARAYLARFQGLKRGLTETSKRASTEVLNREFQERFQVECAALRAPTVNLDFPGREGEARRRKLLTPRHGLDEILSEGEQKAIALADFLAEASLKPDRSPIVFDDPVTSLDHKRLRHVVDRIVELSQDRQVIVFTHDIWFAAELMARFPSDGGAYTSYVVYGASGAVGEVSEGTPRTDSFNDRRDRIDGIISEADKAGGEMRQALIERGYEELRGACEVVAEKDLLQDVAARFRPNVKMGNLRRIRADRLPRAIERVYGVFERSCRFIPSHSQPLATLGVRPALADLRRDWEELQSARQEYRSG